MPPETKFKAKLEHPNAVSLPESQDQEPYYARPIMNALLSSRQWQVKLRSPASLINCVLWKGLIMLKEFDQLLDLCGGSAATPITVPGCGMHASK